MTVPLRVVAIVVVLVAALISGAVVYVPLTTSADTAIDDLLEKLRGEVSANLLQIVRAQFEPVRTLVNSAQTLINTGALNAEDGTAMASWVPTLCSLSTATPFLLQVGRPNQDYAGCISDLTYYRVRSTGDLMAADLQAPAYTLDLSQARVQASGYDPVLRPWYQDLISGNGWSQFYVRSGTPVTSTTAIGGPLMFPNGTFLGVLSVSMHVRSFSETIRNVTFARTGRVVVYDASSGAFLAGNFNQSAAVVNETSGDLRLVELADIGDSLVRTAIAGAGGPTAMQGISSRFSTIIHSSGDGGDTVYVDVVPLRDSYGLNLRILTVIRRGDFTDDLEKDRTVSLVAAFASVFALAFVAALGLFLLLQPVQTLADGMNLANTIAADEDEGGTSSADDHSARSVDDEGNTRQPVRATSVLSEVRGIQEAYVALRDELRRIKRYLPPTMLKRLRAEARGEDPDLDESDEDDCRSVSRGSFMSVGNSQRSGVSSKRGGRRAAASKHRHPPSVGSLSVPTSGDLTGSGGCDSRPMPRRDGTGSGSGGGSVANPLQGVVGAMAAVEAALALNKKRVTVVALNMRQFHRQLSAGELAVAALLRKVVKEIEGTASAWRGMIHLMQGDRVFVSFNAATRSVTHGANAVQFAKSVIENVRASFQVELNAGIASGDAMVGLAGSSAMQQYSILGRPLMLASVLERMCKCATAIAMTTDGGPCSGGLHHEARSGSSVVKAVNTPAHAAEEDASPRAAVDTEDPLIPVAEHSVTSSMNGGGPQRPRQQHLSVLTDRLTMQLASHTVMMRAVNVLALPQHTRLSIVATLVEDGGRCGAPPLLTGGGGKAGIDANNAYEIARTGSLPGGAGSASTTPSGFGTANATDWLFEVDRAERQNTFGAFNKALELFVHDKFDDAIDQLQRIKTPAGSAMAEMCTAATARLRYLHATPTKDIRTELGRFFVDAVLE